MALLEVEPFDFEGSNNIFVWEIILQAAVIGIFWVIRGGGG